MTRILGFLMLASLAACSSSIEAVSDNKVSIRFHNYSDSSTTLQPMADAECAKFGRKAVFTETTMGTGFIGFLTNLPLHAHYECARRG